MILWINNHFSDFENDWKMMAYLEEYDEKMKKTEMSQQQQKLFKVACTLKAEPRSVYIVSENLQVTFVSFWFLVDISTPKPM